MNVSIKYIIDRLTGYDRDEALALAYWIAEEKAGLTRTELLLRQEAVEIPDLDDIIRRLNAREPVQYIFGQTDWMGLRLRVTPATLIPRPETAEILRLLPDTTEPLRVLDIGTGSGCIAIAIKRAHPTWRVSAVDISADALAVARENARRCEADIDFRQADILAQNSKFIIPNSLDLVVSNPPYIMEKEKSTMDSNVLAHEPHGALFVPDDDPLLFYRRIAALRIAPALYFEINEALGSETARMLAEQGYSQIEIYKDSYGKDRFITARIPE